MRYQHTCSSLTQHSASSNISMHLHQLWPVRTASQNDSLDHSACLFKPLASLLVLPWQVPIVMKITLLQETNWDQPWISSRPLNSHQVLTSGISQHKPGDLHTKSFTPNYKCLVPSSYLKVNSEETRHTSLCR